MKRRYLYVLVYAVPTFILSLIVTVIATAAIAGVLWLFVYGDDPWPSHVDRYSAALIIAFFAAVWLALLSLVFAWGKRQEFRAAFNPKHVYLAAGSTLALVGLIGLHQLGVGNIGPPKTDSGACSRFCVAKGFNASTLPGDGTCSCLERDGSEALNAPITHLRDP